MPWTNPTTRNTGDLITASIWNTDLVNNLQYVFDRIVTMIVLPASATNPLGDYASTLISVGNTAVVTFTVPDDFGALVSLELLVSHVSTGTLQYDLSTTYHNPDNNEAYNFHTGNVSNATISVVADRPVLINASPVVLQLAAGDFCGLKITNDGVSGAGQLRVFGARLMYTRT